jgi:hypothetical protein
MKTVFLRFSATALFGLLTATSHAAIVGPVNVLSQVNDGTVSSACSGINSNVNGVSEMELDLDQDGIADVCFGSASNVCTSGFNYDAKSLSGTLLMSTNGFSIMNGSNATLAYWNGLPVDPFQATSGNIGSAGIGVPDVPMVFGFKGGSSAGSANKIGYFSFTVNSSDCSINFGSVDMAASSNTFSDAVVASAPTPAAIPTLGEWAMILLASLMGLFAFSRIRRQS